MPYHKHATLILVLLLATACGGQPREALPGDAAVAAPGQWPAPVGEVELERLDAPLQPTLDVALVVFSADGEQHPFPAIRRHEARLLPVRLRQALQASNAWGVVRVLPEPQASSHLQVQGRILHSDGQRLVLAVRAEDAAGRLWLDTVYHDTSTAEDYPVASGDDPFADLYSALANDLLTLRRGMPEPALDQLSDIATLRYAAGLLPEVFAETLARDDQGRWQLRRLPAADDPMLSRVAGIREREYLFVDTVDQEYLELAESLQPAYDLWRQFTREQALYRADYRRRLADRERAGPPGSYVAMEQAYNAFRWSRIQEQDLEELAQGFENEVRPTVLDVDGRVYRLSGTLEGQYAEWRSILRQILALELGLPAEETLRD